jgi:hypothetical protein
LALSEQYVDDIRLITPMRLAAYIEQHPGSPQTIKLRLAAIKSVVGAIFRPNRALMSGEPTALCRRSSVHP